VSGRIRDGLIAFAIIAGFGSAFVLIVNLLVWSAAWFAYLGEPPRPFPWMLVRFFIALFCIVAAIIGACVALTDEPARTKETDHG
jgi:hypothetical protein